MLCEARGVELGPVIVDEPGFGYKPLDKEETLVYVLTNLIIFSITFGYPGGNQTW